MSKGISHQRHKKRRAHAKHGSGASGTFFLSQITLGLYSQALGCRSIKKAPNAVDLFAGELSEGSNAATCPPSDFVIFQKQKNCLVAPFIESLPFFHVLFIVNFDIAHALCSRRFSPGPKRRSQPSWSQRRASWLRCCW